MHAKSLAAMAAALIMSGSAAAYAQSGNQNPSRNSNSGPMMQGDQSGANRFNQRAMLRQELRQAGFQNIRILDATFLVQAQTGNGQQVLMVVNPPGSGAMSMTGSQMSTGSTGQNSSNGFNTPTRYGSPQYTPPESIPQFGNMNNQNNRNNQNNQN